MKPAILSEKLDKIFKEFGMNYIITHDMDYIDIGENEDEITYTPSEKLDSVKGQKLDPWKSHRNKMKIGRFLNRIMYIDDTDLENFVNWYKTHHNLINGKFGNIFSIVCGEDIRFWYNSKNYVQGGGSLNSSCMRGEESQGRLDLYVQNPDVCKLLIMKKDNKLMGRCLMWTTDHGIYLDRAYCRYDNDIMMYRKFAEYNKYLSYYDKGTTLPPMRVRLRRSYSSAPYLDTFRLNGNSLTYNC